MKEKGRKEKDKERKLQKSMNKRNTNIFVL